MTTNEKLIARIDAFLAKTGMAPTTFGRNACGDVNLVARLKGGASVRTPTYDKIMKYINEYKPGGRRPFGARAA